MKNSNTSLSRKLQKTAFLCSLISLVIWFLPGSYSFLYLESYGTEIWVTSLFDFFPTSILLPLICTITPLLAICKNKTTRTMVWTLLISDVLQCVYLGLIGSICLPYFYGKTFIWLKALPFPLTLISAACFRYSYKDQGKWGQ